MKKALVLRCGALGDLLICSPVFSALKRQGYHVTLYTGARGSMVVKNNPNIDEIILYENEGRYNPDFIKLSEEAKDKVNADWVKDFSESIEVNVALHASSPSYNWPKSERAKRGGKNYYEVTASWCGLNLENDDFRILPEVYLAQEETEAAKKHLKEDKINILWALSGSGANKVYPWTDYIMGELINNYKNINFITVGDERCQILEWYASDELKENTTNLSGLIDFRTTMALTSVVDLVVAPDTGTLHASGAFKTPKVGILGHTTVENITKYFYNDYSLNADENNCECSPCHRLIYDHKVQCPIDNLTGAAWCMSHGQPAERIYNQITKALYDSGRVKERKPARRSSEKVVSDLQPTNV